MADLIKFMAYGIALFGVIAFAFAAFHLGDVLDNISAVLGRIASLMLYATCYIIINCARHRYDLVDLTVEGLHGFNVYWLYGFVGACIPVIGSARIAAFVTTLVVAISSWVIIYG